MGLRDRLEDFTGLTVQPRERLNLLEASDTERRALQRELDMLAYTALDFQPGSENQELQAEERRKLVKRARIIWKKDPLAGAAVDLQNDFVFGRGLSKPNARDGKVQDVIDEFWDDNDNQEALTSYTAQIAFGTDLALASNFFFLIFDDGEDGKVKLGVLPHDLVEGVVRDPNNRLRILYYLARESKVEWDYKNDAPKVTTNPNAKLVYYEHYQNIEIAKKEADENGEQPPEFAPANRVGDGKVFHVAMNKTTDMAFGHPVMDRTIRWMSAINKLMDSRVDMAEAASAFIMKRKIKGTPNQLHKLATQAISRSGSFAAARDPEMQATLGPRPASVLNENEQVDHEPFPLDTKAPQAQQDTQMLRAQVSAAIRFPQAYLGDPSNSNLATATSLELPVLKKIESIQEIVDQVVRFCVDRQIERAVETGRLDEQLSDEEYAEKKAKEERDQPGIGQQQPGPLAMGSGTGDQPADGVDTTAQNGTGPQTPDEQIAADEDRKRDLTYEFSMPNALRRQFGDLVLAVQNVARTFDPNGTNVELSRILLAIALGEGLELADPAAAVEKIFPEGYVDPALQAAQQQAAGGQQTLFGEFGPPGSTPVAADGQGGYGVGAPGPDGQRHGAANPYGGPMQSQLQNALHEANSGKTLSGNGGAALLTPAQREDELRRAFDALGKSLGLKSR